MGKALAKQITGMSWTAKLSLVLVCTVLTSVFMYEGWYKPRFTEAATVTYGVTVPSTASVGIDGAAKLPHPLGLEAHVMPVPAEEIPSAGILKEIM